jgi:nicotinamidase-related amidase
MDFQRDIVELTARGGSATAVERAAVALAAARRKSMPVIFVRVAYRARHLDVAARNKRGMALKEKGVLLEGSDGAELVPELERKSEEAVVTKRRVSALAYTDLRPLLSALDIDTLMLAGLATSGVVLSTVRQAADSDYRLCVLQDACADADRELHDVLMAKVFPTQAEVITVDDFVARLGPS